MSLQKLVHQAGYCDHGYMSMMSTARPGLRAHEDSVKLPPAEIVGGLRELLGARLVAYIGNVSNTRSVRDWAEGQHTPSAACCASVKVPQPYSHGSWA